MPLSDNTTKINNLLSAIDDLPEAGTPLPPLTNPASASDILSGKEAYDDQGVKLTGSYTPTVLPTLTNPASASDILSGKEAIDGQGQKITGTLIPNIIESTWGILHRARITVGANNVTNIVEALLYFSQMASVNEAQVIYFGLVGKANIGDSNLPIRMIITNARYASNGSSWTDGWNGTRTTIDGTGMYDNVRMKTDWLANLIVGKVYDVVYWVVPETTVENIYN